MEREVENHISIACHHNGAAFALLTLLKTKIEVNSGLSQPINAFDAHKYQTDLHVLNESVFYSVLQFDLLFDNFFFIFSITTKLANVGGFLHLANICNIDIKALQQH
jgi:hypothetical protein